MKNRIKQVVKFIGFNEVVIVVTLTFAGLTVWQGERTIKHNTNYQNDSIQLELEKIRIEYLKLASN